MSIGLRSWTGMATALVVMTGVAATTTAGAAPASRSSRVVVPVSIEGGQGTPTGARPMVEVSVGTSAPVPLLLDTGSTGLQIFAPVVKTGAGSGVKLTDQPDRITYSGGTRLTGVVATAKIAIGSQSTAHAVELGYVQQSVCIPSKPTCPGAGGIAAAMARGYYGVLGIGMKRGPDGLASPILGMRTALARSWSIHLSGMSGSLVLGAAVPASGTSIPLSSAGTVGTNRFWDDNLHLCVVVGPAASCAPGLFDSGTFSMQLSQERWATAPVYPGTSVVVAGTPVAVSIRGVASPFWTFTTGFTKSADTIVLRDEVQAFVNTGVQTFYAFTVTYDSVNGAIHLVGAST